jgi:lipoprotein-releasing system permease protein
MKYNLKYLISQLQLQRRNYEPLVWISYRLLLSKSKSILRGTTWVSFLGLVIGVASLVVSMAVMSGFESTLRTSVADVTGHIRVRKTGVSSLDWAQLYEKMRKQEPEIQAYMEYAFVEGVLAHQGKLSGVILQGVDLAKMREVLHLSSRLAAGEFRIQDGEVPEVLIGKGLAKQFALSPGQLFKVVFPMPSGVDPNQFRRKLVSFKVSGILDLGKKEFDDFLLIVALPTLQKIAENKISNGILLRVSNIDHARAIALHLGERLGAGYIVSDWKDVNENIFEAVEIERIVVFFVVFIIIMASAFNVSSTLYINVVRRYPEIGILKALGVSRRDIIKIFSLQGLMLGLLGLVLGVGLGIVLCFVVSWAESYFSLIPTSVYKVDHIDLSLRFWDLLWISISTLLICFLATLAPAFRGARLMPVEGLKND